MIYAAVFLICFAIPLVLDLKTPMQPEESVIDWIPRAIVGIIPK